MEFVLIVTVALIAAESERGEWRARVQRPDDGEAAVGGAARPPGPRPGPASPGAGPGRRRSGGRQAGRHEGQAGAEQAERQGVQGQEEAEVPVPGRHDCW